MVAEKSSRASSRRCCVCDGDSGGLPWESRATARNRGSAAWSRGFTRVVPESLSSGVSGWGGMVGAIGALMVEPLQMAAEVQKDLNRIYRLGARWWMATLRSVRHERNPCY